MKIRISIILFLVSFAIQAQENSLTLLTEDPLTADTFIGIDDYDAMYFIKNNQLNKKSVQGDYQFTALQLGTIASVDILNPLKITVFYEGSNTVVILDNTLTEIRRIDFTGIESFRNISHATTAGDRKLWIYNTDLQQLEIYDWNLDKVITQFPPMKTNITGIASNFNFAWVLDNGNITQYNSYGSYVQPEDLKNTKVLRQWRGDLLALAGKKLYYKKKGDTTFVSLDLPDLELEQFSFNDEILYIYSGQKVTSFRLKPPK